MAGIQVGIQVFLEEIALIFFKKQRGDTSLPATCWGFLQLPSHLGVPIATLTLWDPYCLPTAVLLRVPHSHLPTWGSQWPSPHHEVPTAELLPWRPLVGV